MHCVNDNSDDEERDGKYEYRANRSRHVDFDRNGHSEGLAGGLRRSSLFDGARQGLAATYAHPDQQGGPVEQRQRTDHGPGHGKPPLCRSRSAWQPNAELSGGRSVVQALSRGVLQNTVKALNRNASSARPLQRDVRRAMWWATPSSVGHGSRWTADARARGPARTLARYRTTWSRAQSARARARASRCCPSPSPGRRAATPSPVTSGNLPVGIHAGRRTPLACLRPHNARAQLRANQIEAHAQHAQSLNRPAAAAPVSMHAQRS